MVPAFSTCIWPMSPEEFISEHRGKSPIHFRGTSSKYASLLDTQELDDVLSRLVVAPRVFQIRKDNGALPEDEVTSPTVNNTRRTIKSQVVEQQLKNGATLAFENCESHFPKVHEMCSMLAEVFLARVYANLFVVYEPERPCALHWDDWDMFICQVAGCKRWPIYKPLYENPVFDQKHASYKTPASELAHEFMLEPGDGLYLPRGWPHQPAAVEAPSVHIAFSISIPTGMDLLDWVRADLKQTSAELRADLPLLVSEKARREYGAMLREKLLRSLSDEALERYYQRYCASVAPRPVKLPAFGAQEAGIASEAAS